MNNILCPCCSAVIDLDKHEYLDSTAVHGKVTPAMINVLIAMRKNKRYGTEIAKELGISQPATSEILCKMEKINYQSALGKELGHRDHSAVAQTLKKMVEKKLLTKKKIGKRVIFSVVE